MVYGFILIGSVLVGAIYWISSICQEQGAMWSPGGGILKPEPWLQTNYGGYGGWEPSETQYSDWSPGAYLNLFTTTRRTTTRRRPIKTKRPRKPITFPPRLPTEAPVIIPPSSSSEIIEEITETPVTSVEDTSPEESDAIIPPSDTEPTFDEFLRPPPQEETFQVQVTEEPSAFPGGNAYEDYNAPHVNIFGPQEWRTRDQNEEAYEERPRDLTNTRPPDKLPVGGWGYEYDS